MQLKAQQEDTHLAELVAATLRDLAAACGMAGPEMLYAAHAGELLAGKCIPRYEMRTLCFLSSLAIMHTPRPLASLCAGFCFLSCELCRVPSYCHEIQYTCCFARV